jgi:hypothetical protein
MGNKIIKNTNTLQCASTALHGGFVNLNKHNKHRNMATFYLIKTTKKVKNTINNIEVHINFELVAIFFISFTTPVICFKSLSTVKILPSRALTTLDMLETSSPSSTF